MLGAYTIGSEYGYVNSTISLTGGPRGPGAPAGPGIPRSPRTNLDQSGCVRLDEEITSLFPRVFAVDELLQAYNVHHVDVEFEKSTEWYVSAKCLI